MNQLLVVGPLALPGEPAADAAEALTLWLSGRFDAVLVGDMAVLAALRERLGPAELPVVFVGGDAAAALTAGANDQVPATVGPAELAARVAASRRLLLLSRLADRGFERASHDLKNPLTSVLGVASIVTAMVAPGAVLTEKMYRLLQNLEKGARQLRDLLEDDLDFRVLRAGAIELERGEVDLAGLLLAAVEDVTPRRPPGSSLEVQIGDDVSVVSVDARRVRQVVTALLDNALRHGQGMPVTLTAAVTAGAVSIEVRDGGPGLADGLLPRVFTRHAKLDTTGGGVSLAVCRAIAEAHGGTLTAENRDGACFRLTLPR